MLGLRVRIRLRIRLKLPVIYKGNAYTGQDKIEATRHL